MFVKYSQVLNGMEGSKQMRKNYRLKRMLAAGLAAVMLAGGMNVSVPEEARAAETDINWEQIREVVSRYYGEWTDTTYPGQMSDLTPDTALMGNGDVGVNSGGSADEKTFYISKGNFWEYNGTQKALGGYTIRGQQEERADLAYKKPVQVSSQFTGEAKGTLVDGDDQTQWTSSEYNHYEDHWAVVDLGTVKKIGYWVVKNRGVINSAERNLNTSDFRLEYSNDGESWNKIADITGNTQDIVTGVTDVEARYVRLYITKGSQSDNQYARIAELELYEEESSSNTFAPEYVSVLSSSNDTYGLGNFGDVKAVDGSFQQNETGWGWCTYPIDQSVQEPQWLQVNFSEEKYLVQYRLFSDGAAREIARECNSYDFQLQYRNGDEEEWQTADDVRANTENIYNKVLDKPIRAKQFRIYITDPVQPEYDRTQDVRAKISNLEFYSVEQEFDTSSEPAKFYEKQDILNARVLTELELGGIPVSMETFTAAEENVVVTKLTDNGTEPLSLEADTWVKSDDRNRPVEIVKNKNGTISAARSTYNSNPSNPGSHTSKAVITTAVVGAESERAAGTDKVTHRFTINPGESVYLVSAVAGGGQTYDNTGKLTGEDPVEVSAALLEKYSDEYAVAELKEGHQNWWKNYWSASYVDFGTEDEKLNSVQKYYYGAQYILGCSVRDGKTAPGIMGIWCNTDNPKWSNHYQLNYNHNAVYYGFGSSNRPEFNKAAFQVILDYMEQGKKNAESITELQKLDWVDAYWVQPGGDTLYVDKRLEEGTLTEEGISGGVLYPAGIIPFGQSACAGLYHNQTANASYSALAGVEYYKYTMDEDYLQDYLYDYLKACAAFYERWMECDEATGQYNVYAGFHEQSWGYNPTIELLTIDFLFDTLINASETLGLDADRREKWIDIRDHLAPMKVAELNGRNVIAFAEKKWEGGDTYEFNESVLVKTDGNVTQLDGLCLDGTIGGYFSDPQLLETIRSTLSISEQSWLHGNHFTRTYPVAVRSRYDIGTIIDFLSTMIDTNIQPNLRIKDDYHGLEKCANIMAVNEMLLIADDGIVKLFPNWYTDKDAKFASLRAKGAFTVSAEYDGTAQEAKNVTITSEAGEDMTLVSPWEEGMTVKDAQGNIVETEKGAVLNWEDQENAAYTFATTEGETYTIEKGEAETEKPSKSTLQYFMDKAKEHQAAGDVDDCVESIQNLFAEAVAEGEVVMADENATYEEIMNTTVKLMKAIQALDMKAADKTDLEMAVELAKSIDLTDYVEAGQTEFQQALSDAKGILSDGDAMQEETDAAWSAFVDALGSLRLKADKSALEDLLNSLEELDLSPYTEESAAVFRTAFASARAVLADSALSVDEQKMVDDAVQALNDAKEKLELKDGTVGDSIGDGGTGDESTGNGDDDTGNEGSNTGDGDGQTPGSGDNSGNSGNADSSNTEDNDTGNSSAGNAEYKAESPKTGDEEIPFSLPALAAAALAGGIMLTILKKKRNG